jgi:hypothetical protein
MRDINARIGAEKFYHQGGSGCGKSTCCTDRPETAGAGDVCTMAFVLGTEAPARQRS